MDRSVAVLGAVLGLLLASLPGCSDDAARPSGVTGPGGGTTLPNSPDPCAPPGPGCPCSNPGVSTTCVVKRVSGSYVSCSEGTMQCGADGVWGACEGAATVWQGPVDASASDEESDATD